MNNWQTKNFKDYTLEDALQAAEEGIYTAVNDGQYISQANCE
jgi:hypothetical protein